MREKLSKSGRKVINDQGVIRAMSPPGRDTAKWLARLMGIPVRTARFWAEQSVPVYRREDLYLLMIEDFHRVTKWREEELWPALCRGAGLVNGDSVESVTAPSSFANKAADLIDAAADCFEAAFDWLGEEDG
jgi:hypothetical protein